MLIEIAPEEEYPLPGAISILQIILAGAYALAIALNLIGFYFTTATMQSFAS